MTSLASCLKTIAQRAQAFGLDIGRGRGPLYHIYNLSDKDEN